MAIAMLPEHASAEDCRFGFWQEYRGVKIFRDPSQKAYLYQTDHAAIDADGAPNAYHPDDVKSYDCKRRQYCPAQGKGLDCPANAGYPCSLWWKEALVADPDVPDRALVQSSGRYQGYFVSKTSLFDTLTTDISDPRRYVNATEVPYIVFPGQFYAMKGTGKFGDVGVAHHRGTKQSTAFIVADAGPKKAPLGEGSIALFRALGVKDTNPRTGGTLTDGGQIVYIVFPYSVDEREIRWPVSSTQISEQAERLFERFGGAALFDQCVAQ